jgi:acyl-CoA oxidase
LAETASETSDQIGAVDSVALGEYLNHPYEEVRRESREMFDRVDFELPPAEIGSAEYREQVLEWARMLAEERQTVRGFPTEYGGGGDIGGSIAAFETLAMGDLSLLVKCGVQFGLFGGAVLHLGTRRHHEAYLADIATLELPGAFAMSESAHGSDVQSVGTTATYDPEAGEFVIETPNELDRKDWIGNAALHGRIAAVFAQLIVAGENHGVHALLVPLRDEDGSVVEGVRIEDIGHKVGLNGVDNGRIYFDGVRVPRTNLLDRYGSVSSEGTYSSPIDNPTRRFFTMIGTLVQGRVSVAGGGISVAKVSLTTAVRHGLRRRQFGPPDGGEEVLLLDYLAHQRRLLPRLAKTYALQFIQDEMIASLDEIFSGSERDEQARRALETKAAGVKALATWHAIDCVQAGREACGGLGYLTENGFGRRQADVEIFSTFEGDNTVLLQLVAKSLLTGYRDEFGELNPLGMAAFFVGDIVERVVERSAARELLSRIWDEVTPDSEEEGDLANHDYQAALLAWREEHLLATAARRLRGGIDAGYEPFDVFNACQDHILTLARAHIERLVLEAFIKGVEACEHPANRELLSRVCDLYALNVIEENRDWLQEHGRISSTRSKAVIRSVNRLCGELRPHAGALVDALGVPDSVLGPIGRSRPAA